MKVYVTRDDMIHATPGDPHNCVLCKAILREYAHVKAVTIGKNHVSVDDRMYKHTVESLALILEYQEHGSVGRLPQTVELIDA